jgi:uncharacterized protein (DUF608 family)
MLQDVMKRHYKARSGLPLGGIGAGWFELRKDGCFHNWNIFNNQPLFTGEKLPHKIPYADDTMLFFVVRYQEKGEHPKMKILQVESGEEVGHICAQMYQHPWMSGVDEIEYRASFPFTWMTFRDAEMPFEIDLEAWSPFIPHDVKNSSLPAAFFSFHVRSKTKNPVEVMLMVTQHNAVGYDVGEKKYYVSNLRRAGGATIVEQTAGGMTGRESSFGSLALASLGAGTSYYVGWDARHPYYEIAVRQARLPNVDDTEGRNKVDARTGRKFSPMQSYSTIAASRSLRAKGSFSHTFAATWHFPNLYAAAPPQGYPRVVKPSGRLEGHYYDNFFNDAAEVARYVIRTRRTLEAQTRAFHRDFFDSSLPPYVLDQVNSHLATFFTSAWLTKAGDFGIQEGITLRQSWGPLATIDVGFYGSVATAALFPNLHESMMRAHQRLQCKRGTICHGIQQNFRRGDATEAVSGRLDLPAQYAILALQGYFWSGDKTYLREIWPSVLKALDYVLRERDANGDLLPDMTGVMCTYDNFPMYGAASYVSSIWLAALKYTVEAARALGDKQAVDKWSEILEKGARAFEDKLWNGRYYRLSNDEGGPHGGVDEGCLVDQLAGQWVMHHAGFGHLFRPQRIRKALRHILKECSRPWGLVNCRWPGEPFLADVPADMWADQHNTVWTGVELAFAGLLIYEGLVKEGLGIVKAVDDRYRKAGLYFDHQEWGGHYYRPMSSWTILNALLGLHVHGTSVTLAPRLRDKRLRLFFSAAGAAAHYERHATARNETIAVRVRAGSLKLRDLTLGLAGGPAKTVSLRAGGKQLTGRDFTFTAAEGELRLRLRRTLSLRTGRSIEVFVGR